MTAGAGGDGQGRRERLGQEVTARAGGDGRGRRGRPGQEVTAGAGGDGPGRKGQPGQEGTVTVTELFITWSGDPVTLVNHS